MKNFYIIGGSGTGKTFLAKNLERWFPENFVRTVEMTNREPREGEIDGYDYNFLSFNEIDSLIKEDKIFEEIQYQFGPGRVYGCRYEDLDKEKWNVIVAAIEGIITGLNNTKPEDESIILNIIIDDELDVFREDRLALTEQYYNLAILRNMFSEKGRKNLYSNLNITYGEINLSELKRIRNNKTQIGNFLEKFFRFKNENNK